MVLQDQIRNYMTVQYRKIRNYMTVQYRKIRNYMTVQHCQIRNYMTAPLKKEGRERKGEEEGRGDLVGGHCPLVF